MDTFVTIIRTGMIGTAAMMAVVSVPAIAASTGEPQSIEVSYGDLNLASASGRDRLQSRVRRAAAKVCGYEQSSRELARSFSTRSCMKRANTNANVEIAALVNGSRLGEQRTAMVVLTPKFAAHSGN